MNHPAGITLKHYQLGDLLQVSNISVKFVNRRKQNRKKTTQEKKRVKKREICKYLSHFLIFLKYYYRSLPLLMFQVLCRPSLTSTFIAFTPCRHKQSNIGRQENEFKFLPLSISELSHEFMKTTVIC